LVWSNQVTTFDENTGDECERHDGRHQPLPSTPDASRLDDRRVRRLRGSSAGEEHNFTAVFTDCEMLGYSGLLRRRQRLLDIAIEQVRRWMLLRRSLVG